MAPIDYQSNANGSIDWLGLVRILLAQVFVLLALAGAFVGYLNWSSDVAWREFISANAPPLSSPHRQPPSQAPVQAVKATAMCPRRA